MKFLGILIFIVCGFTTFFLEMNKNLKGSTVSSIFFMATLMGVLLIAVGACPRNESHVYEYIVNVHYIDGYSKIVKFESRSDPKVMATWRGGAYYFSCSEFDIPGVIRFEIISKTEKIK